MKQRVEYWRGYHQGQTAEAKAKARVYELESDLAKMLGAPAPGTSFLSEAASVDLEKERREKEGTPPQKDLKTFESEYEAWKARASPPDAARPGGIFQPEARRDGEMVALEPGEREIVSPSDGSERFFNSVSAAIALEARASVRAVQLVMQAWRELKRGAGEGQRY